MKKVILILLGIVLLILANVYRLSKQQFTQRMNNSQSGSFTVTSQHSDNSPTPVITGDLNSGKIFVDTGNSIDEVEFDLDTAPSSDNHDDTINIAGKSNSTFRLSQAIKQVMPVSDGSTLNKGCFPIYQFGYKGEQTIDNKMIEQQKDYEKMISELNAEGKINVVRKDGHDYFYDMTISQEKIDSIIDLIKKDDINNNKLQTGTLIRFNEIEANLRFIISTNVPQGPGGATCIAKENFIELLNNYKLNNNKQILKIGNIKDLLIELVKETYINYSFYDKKTYLYSPRQNNFKHYVGIITHSWEGTSYDPIIININKQGINFVRNHVVVERGEYGQCYLSVDEKDNCKNYEGWLVGSEKKSNKTYPKLFKPTNLLSPEKEIEKYFSDIILGNKTSPYLTKKINDFVAEVEKHISY